ncbi:hypothetical protein NQ318_018010 [Aromia moschata]|uniref:Uncharacterized protein n=1 Tax=Aromia moschata TaxID=1265417 RepID=A0AAV8Y9S4_9CUCU|nr:hypothetical protein NQ318_018010 [Aromia moschata]
MAGKFSFGEQVDMLLVSGFCEANCRRSVEEHRKRFSNCMIPIEKHFPMLKDGLEKQAGSPTCPCSVSVLMRNTLYMTIVQSVMNPPKDEHSNEEEPEEEVEIPTTKEAMIALKTVMSYVECKYPEKEQFLNAADQLEQDINKEVLSTRQLRKWSWILNRQKAQGAYDYSHVPTAQAAESYVT